MIAGEGEERWERKIGDERRWERREYCWYDDEIWATMMPGGSLTSHTSPRQASSTPTSTVSSSLICMYLSPLTSSSHILSSPSLSPTPSPQSPTLTFLIVLSSHLDHCGALPYFTEMCGYDGPIFMTVCPSSFPFLLSPLPSPTSSPHPFSLFQHPTKAICPILLEDYRKIMVDRKGETNFFTSQMIKNCMRKVKVVNLHQVCSSPSFHYSSSWVSLQLFYAFVFFLYSFINWFL